MKNRLACVLSFLVVAGLWGAVAPATRAAASPIIQQTLPAPGSTVETLTFINVTFDTSVTGVNASDLLINGTPAASLLTVSDREYQFNFTQPPTGAVSVTMDHLALPGALVSGRVTFSDGETGVWMLDQSGRPGLDPDNASYRPTQEDIQAVQQQLRAMIEKSGL